MIKDRKTIDALLWKNIKRLEQPGWSFAYDCNLNPPEVWDTAELKVLIVFLSDGSARAVSSTDLALNGLIKHNFGDRVFVDLCYFPLPKTREVLDELEIPWMIGDVSHAPAEDYDIVFVSNSIINERHNLYVYFRKSGIEPWANKRLQDSNVPLFLMGGSSVAVGASFYGNSEDGTGRSLVELTYAGFAEKYLKEIVGDLIELKKQEKLKDKRYVLDYLYKYPCVFSPLDYEWVYKSNSIEITEIKKLNPKAHDVGEIEFAKPTSDILKEPIGFSYKILHSEGSFDSVDEIISYGCSSGGSCRFCEEGGLVSWREVELQTLLEKIKRSKKLSLANSYNSYSYNTPYHSQLNDILWNAANMFDSISAIAFRADIVAAKPDFVKMFRTLGAQRQTVAIEGISDRIRNGYLNKNLSWEELRNACKAFFENRFMQMKLFLILTGLEEKDDFDEFWREMDKIYEMRAQMGASTFFVFSFTAQVYFPNTPLQYEPRRSSQNLLIRKRNLGEFIDEVHKRGSRVRFSSRGRDTIYEQLLLDLGPLFTKYYERAYEQLGFVFSNSISEKLVDATLDWAQRLDKLSIDTILGSRTYDFIFPDSLVHTNNQKFLIKSHKKAVKFISEPMCLPTLAKPKSGGCLACGQCGTAEEIQKVQNRVIDKSEHSLLDIQLSVSANRPRHRVRAVFEASYLANAINKKALATYYLTKMYSEQSETISRIENDPFYWGSSKDFPLYFYGKYFVDITSKTPIPTGVDKSKYSSKFVKLVSIMEMPFGSKVSIKDYALMLVCVPFDDRFMNRLTQMPFNVFPFDDSTSMQQKWSEFEDKQVLPPQIKVVGDKLYLLMDMPLKANVLKYLSMGSCYSYRKMLELADVRVLGYYSRAQYRTCKVCNKNSTYVDLTTNKIAENCILCSGKVLLAKV